MDPGQLNRLLEQVRRGELSVKRAARELFRDPPADLEHVILDLDRLRRRGVPEAVLGEGKTPQQVAAIVDRLVDAGQTAMVTRASDEMHRTVAAVRPEAEWHAAARMITVRGGPVPEPTGCVLVLSGGTSDLAVAEEAAVTASTLGCLVERIYDVGVAGLHRLLARHDALRQARVIVAVAGMEGALPSVVAGLVACPVIGVPTSTGYGTGSGGQAALLAMLNSCAGGLTVVNVDNGFGAGLTAALINRM